MERGPCTRPNKDFERRIGTVRFGSRGKNHITRSLLFAGKPRYREKEQEAHCCLGARSPGFFYRFCGFSASCNNMMPERQQAAFDVREFRPLGRAGSSIVTFWSHLFPMPLSPINYLLRVFLHRLNTCAVLGCKSFRLASRFLVNVRPRRRCHACRLLCWRNGRRILRSLLNRRRRASVCSLPQAETRKDVCWF
jgi:hypothetical protein